jgi:hypothetical protein
MMSSLRKFGGVLVALALLALTVGVVSAQESLMPGVTVDDQALDEETMTVTIASVTSDGPGWIVIHADSDGAPGPVIGYEAVMDGENTDVVVTVDLDGLTPTLWAMLHTDAGELGVYEFPGADGPVRIDGSIVMSSFSITADALAATAAEAEMETDDADVEAADAAPIAAQLLPETGGTLLLYPVIAAVAAGLLLVGAGLALKLRRAEN